MSAFQLFFFSRVGLRTYQHPCIRTVNSCTTIAVEHAAGTEGIHKYVIFWFVHLKGRNHTDHVAIDARIILKWVFKKWGGRSGLDLSGSSEEPVASLS